jgi:SAM-dependent methyltransferase
MDASIGLRKSTASGGLEDGSQRMWLFHTVTLVTELSHGNANRPLALGRASRLPGKLPLHGAKDTPGSACLASGAVDHSDRTKALAQRLRTDALGALELYTLYLGERLGLYRALADGDPVTSTELADRTGTVERYVREWLEQHAASGLLEVDDPAAEPLERRYRMPSEHVPVLAERDHLLYQAHRGVELVRAGRPMPDLVEAFRSGGAPPPIRWEPEGRAEFNRPIYLQLLGREWLPAIPDIDERLRADPPARVADVACGTGWSSIAMARAYPKIAVHGSDLDEDAIALARSHLEEEDPSLAERVTFSVEDAAHPSLAGRFDLVTILEALHDMSRPVEALRAARAMLADGGSVLIADELVGETFTAPASEDDRLAYGWSVVSCLPYTMDDPQTAATGAVMRPSTLRRCATEAGFGDVEVLPIENDWFLFYRLLP